MTHVTHGEHVVDRQPPPSTTGQHGQGRGSGPITKTDGKQECGAQDSPRWVPPYFVFSVASWCLISISWAMILIPCHFTKIIIISSFSPQNNDNLESGFPPNTSQIPPFLSVLLAELGPLYSVQRCYLPPPLFFSFW